MEALRGQRLLVLGGTGAVGAGVAALAAGSGIDVTLTGRRAEPDASIASSILAGDHTRYVSLDVARAEHAATLGALLEWSTLVVIACEPWTADALADEVAEAYTQLYALALERGFGVDENDARAQRGELRKRIVRIGSVAAELPHALLDGGVGFAEDRVSLEVLEARAREDAATDHAYFALKRTLARCAEQAVSRGLDLVHALPTYVVSAWGDRGEEEPLVQAWRSARRTGFVPAVPLNAVPADVAAESILLLALIGSTGERYQVTGVETDTCTLHGLSLRHLGIEPRALVVPREELRDEMRLLSGAGRGNALLDLWLMPWDLTRKLLLERHAVEAWHLGVLLEGANRSDAKLRARADGRAEARGGLAPRAAEAVWRRLEAVGLRKAARLGV